MTRLAALFLILATIPAIASKIPDSAWQDGKLRDMTTDSNSRLVGVANEGHAILTTSVMVVTHYFIDGLDGYAYEANRLVKGRRGRQLLVTIHGPIKFALVGHDFYIKDDEGKTQKLAFISRAIQPPPDSKKE